jgi:hypothetical protein
MKRQLGKNNTELQHLISDLNANAQIGEITRACYRYGMASHSDMLRDAKKIRFYAQAEVERLEKLGNSSVVSSVSIAASEHPYNQNQSIPSWDDAPEWATDLMVANFEVSLFEKYQFALKRDEAYYDSTDCSVGFIIGGQEKLWLVHSSRPTSTAQ